MSTEIKNFDTLSTAEAAGTSKPKWNRSMSLS